MTRVLLNPHAQGGRAARRIPALRAWLATHAPDAQLAAPEALQDSVALLQSLPEDSRVVVVGGDGTLNCWLPTLLARRLTVGLVPMGSGNDSARAWGVHGLPWAQALALALQGPAQAIDTGLARWCDLQGWLQAAARPWGCAPGTARAGGAACRVTGGPRCTSGSTCATGT